MINYQPLWETMRKKQVTTYALINTHGISARTINHLKHNKGVTLHTLEKLCKILDCMPNEVVRFD